MARDVDHSATEHCEIRSSSGDDNQTIIKDLARLYFLLTGRAPYSKDTIPER